MATGYSADARNKLISLTEKADLLEPELLSVGDEIEDRLTENLSSEERKQFVILLQKLISVGI